MRNQLFSVPIIFFLLSVITANKADAQCTNAQVNWDNLDYLHRNSTSYSNYITSGMFAPMVQTQKFAIGVNYLTITHNFISSNNIGENTTHTGDASSRSTGADVEYRGNGTITVTFGAPVSNVNFSLYDIDRSQTATVTAFNGITPVNVTMARASGTSLSVSGSGSPTAIGVANNTTYAVTGATASSATLNVDITGPITHFIIVITTTSTCSSSCGTGGTENGQFWLSDIEACVTGSFPTGYYEVSEPLQDQPAYVLAVHDLNTVYMVNPADGRAVAVFQDNDPRVREINDLAYDPHKRIIYYSVDGIERCSPAGDQDSIRHIKKYDLNTETITKIIDNVNNSPLYLPTFWYGLESGGAAFYNGSLFVGVEGTQSGSNNTGREGIIWRIDFDPVDSITPIRAVQQAAWPVDNGSTLLHDWGDFVIKDGVLYDFNSASSSSNGNYNLFDMQTGVITATHNGTSSANKPRQVAQQWNGTLYWMHTEIGLYNGTNGVSGKETIAAAARSATWVAGAGDAAEAFRPKVDFGDAPASYDPVLRSPAFNERDTALRIGATFDWEWDKNGSLDATGDGGDEDGLAYVPIFDPSLGAYHASVAVYNHTGSNAYLCAWLDYNGNGVFDASEGLTRITVPTGTGMQNFNLYWNGITTPIASGTYTYLRIRLTSDNDLATTTPTGYFFDGETEDYRVLVDDFPLSVNIVSFNAKAMNSSTVRLSWTSALEYELTGYGLERSPDGINWTTIGFVNAKGNGNAGNTDYIFNDVHALKGKSYYRLKLLDRSTTFQYSEIRNVTIKDQAAVVSISPNPAQTNATVYITSENNADAMIIFHDMQGRKMRTTKHRLFTGGNSIELNNLDQLPDGTYIVQIITGQQTINKKIVIGKTVF